MSLTQISLDANILAKLDSLAQSLSISRDAALQMAISAFIEDQEFRADVAQGIDDLEEGRVFPANEVDGYFANKRASLKKLAG